MAIRASSRDRVQAIRRLIEWPISPDPEWRKCFLAGIFDAEGSYSQGVWRISNTDPEIIGWTVSSMKSFGFDVVVDFEYLLDEGRPLVEPGVGR